MELDRVGAVVLSKITRNGLGLGRGESSKNKGRAERARQIHRAIGPTVGYLRGLRDQLDRSGLSYEDPFYRAVSNAHQELNKLFVRSVVASNPSGAENQQSPAATGDVVEPSVALGMMSRRGRAA